MAFTKITGDPLNVIAPGWQLLSSATASSSATIDFDSGIDFTAFPIYAVTWSGVTPATDNTVLRLRLSDDGGSTYEADASDYSYNALGLQGSTEVNVGSTQTYANLMNGATASIGNASGEHTSGFILVHSMSDSSVQTQWGGITSWISTTGQASVSVCSGMINALAVTDGIRLLMSSGNISIGEFKLYGVA